MWNKFLDKTAKTIIYNNFAFYSQLLFLRNLFLTVPMAYCLLLVDEM